MAFEGEHKVIPIKGIARAGADTVCEDGAMNEVIGLEYKDGSYVPYAATMLLSNVVPNDATAIYTHKTTKGEIVIIDQATLLRWKYKNDFDNNTGSWKPLASTGRVSFVGDAITVLTANDISTYVFNGLTYDKFENDLTAYNSNLMHFRVTRGIAGHENVKDRDGINNKPISVQYLSSSLYGSIGSKASDIKERFDEFVSASGDLSLGSSLLTRASGMLAEKGGLQGYFLVCYAFRLTNGDIVQASMPVLMSPPFIKQGGNFSNPFKDERVNSFKLYRNDDQSKADGSSPNTSMKEINISGVNSDMWDSPQYGLSTGVTIDGKMILSSECENVEIEGLCSDTMQFLYQTIYTGEKKTGVTGKTWNDVHGGSWGSSVKWFFPLCYDDVYESVIKDYDEDEVSLERLAATSTMPLTSSITIHIRNGQIKGDGDDAYKYDDIYKTIACQGLSNKLQIAIDANQCNRLPETVASVCIFISPEISPFADLSNDSSVNMHGLFVGGKLGFTGTTTSNNVRLMHTFSPKYRSKNLVIEDIKNITSMYKVKEISREELISMAEKNIDASGNTMWVDIDLRGLLGDALLTNESLPITAFDYTRYIANSSIDYNYRLHIGDIKRKLYKGYGRISLWNDYNNGRGQNNNVVKEDEQYQDTDILIGNSGELKTYGIITATYIKNEDSSESVVVSNEGNLSSDSNKKIWGLNKFIAYPNPNAYKMDIYKVTYLSGEYHYDKRTITLIPNKYLGFSYYLSDDLEMLSLTSNMTSSEVIEPSNDVRNSPNIIRVSSTAAPHVIPAKNTYTVGNGRVLGFARINTALSDDTYGKNPLLIFATDGIYTMEVDTTGVGAYATSPNLFSNEICVNANSICEISGGVVFASSKGLMLATPSGVIPFVPLLNGIPKHNPQQSHNPFGYGLKLYRSMTNYIGINDYISKNDFIEFIKDIDTHVVYIGVKNKLYIYNNGNIDRNIKASAYWVDIESRITTKLTDVFKMNDNDKSDATFIRNNNVFKFKYTSQDSRIPVLLQTRPIKVDVSLKTSYRVVLRGYFSVEQQSYDYTDLFSSLLVLGSLDGEHWQPIGCKEKPILSHVSGTTYEQPFHDIGCVTDRVSVKYIMVIFASQLDVNSHIDHIELTVNSKYNNKLR